jgi:hypothetical protein
MTSLEQGHDRSISPSKDLRTVRGSEFTPTAVRRALARFQRLVLRLRELQSRPTYFAFPQLSGFATRAMLSTWDTPTVFRMTPTPSS